MRFSCAVFIALIATSFVSTPFVAANEHSSVALLASGVDASFRGIVVVDSNTIVVGGSKGTVLRSVNAGATWTKLIIADDATELDFRDIESTADGGLILMSAGPGEKSRIYRSDDQGQTWKLTHQNNFEKGFFNGAAFWQNGTGLVIGDPIDGRLFLLKTSDFGKTWDRVQGPELMEGEYGFAASGTGIVTSGNNQAWVVTGAAASRVFKTSDYGMSWISAETGVRNGEQGSGIFSIAVSERFGVVVGGDYQKPELSERNCAWITLANADGAWSIGEVSMSHKACVRFVDKSTVLAVGRTGIVIATLPGLKWKTITTESFYTFDYDASTSTAYLAGADGRIGKLTIAAEP